MHDRRAGKKSEMSNQQERNGKQANQEPDREVDESLLRGRMANIGQKLLVLSGKGGVGKSTVAANLAVSLASTGKTVGLLDVDVHGPSIPKLMGLEGRRPEMENQHIVPIHAAEKLKVMSIAFLLDSASDAVIWRGPLKYNVIRQFLKDVDWGQLDFLVVDSPPGTGDEPLSVAQLVGAPAGAVIVTTPQDLAVSDVRRCVSFCEKLSLPVIGIIENMSGLICPHCGETIDLFKSGGGKTLAEEVHVPFLGQIPIDPRIVESGDAGTPFVEQFGQTEAATAFARVIDQIVKPQKQNKQPAHVNVVMENVKMKIAIPLANGLLSMHFGHCDQFALLEIDEATKTIVKTELSSPPGYEPGALPKWLNEQGANVIVAGGIGQRAQQLLAESGISVVVGAPVDTPENIATAYLNGTLKAGDNICDH